MNTAETSILVLFTFGATILLCSPGLPVSDPANFREPPKAEEGLAPVQAG